MGSVFKRAGRRKWYYKVQLPSGEWSSPRTGFVDKRATEQKRAAEQARIDRGEVGLVDPFEDARAASFESLVEDFTAELRLKGRANRYVADTQKRLQLFAEAMQIRVLPDATIAKVNEFLGRLLRAEGLPPQRRRDRNGKPLPRRPVSMRTRDAYVEAFWAW